MASINNIGGKYENYVKSGNYPYSKHAVYAMISSIENYVISCDYIEKFLGGIWYGVQDCWRQLSGPD